MKMRKINENHKVTLTFGQLKKLVKEGKRAYIKEDVSEDDETTIDEIKRIINHYFENDPWTDKPNNFYDPNLSASEVIDQIVDILS